MIRVRLAMHFPRPGLLAYILCARKYVPIEPACGLSPPSGDRKLGNFPKGRRENVGKGINKK